MMAGFRGPGVSPALWMLLAACSGGVDAVVTDLASRNPVVREDALIEAREVVDPAVTRALEAALADADARIRLQAVLALDEHADPASVGPLASHVTDPDPDVAKAAIDALGRLKSPDAVPALIAVVEVPDPPLNAIWALGAIGDNRALDALTRLRGHSDPWVRYNADRALRSLE